MKVTKRMDNVPIDRLIPYARNARTHSKDQINKLRSSLREFGFVNPVLIDGDYNIIAGHGRVMAGKEEGMKEVPCVFVEHLTEAQRKAYILADNRLAMDADWDDELLALELFDLNEMDFHMEAMGFSAEELEFAMVNEDDFGEDFDLPDGDKPPFQQMTFTLADEQADFVREMLKKAKEDMADLETFGNENSNGNALYKVVMEWAEQRT